MPKAVMRIMLFSALLLKEPHGKKNLAFSVNVGNKGRH